MTAVLQITLKKAWLLYNSLMTTATKPSRSWSTASGSEMLSAGKKTPTFSLKYYPFFKLEANTILFFFFIYFTSCFSSPLNSHKKKIRIFQQVLCTVLGMLGYLKIMLVWLAQWVQRLLSGQMKHVRFVIFLKKSSVPSCPAHMGSNSKRRTPLPCQPLGFSRGQCPSLSLEGVLDTESAP